MDNVKKIIEWIKMYKHFVFVGIILVFVIIKGLFGIGNADNEDENMISMNQAQDSKIENNQISKSNKETEHISKNEDTVKDVVVDVKGAVSFPNTYKMTTTDRINDVLQKAQVKSNADLSKINLSEKLKDQMYIYIPIVGESAPPTQLASEQSNKLEVNINTATKEQIEKLPGIGPSKAESIVRTREAEGEFKSIEDLKKVKGFGDKTIESLKEFIVLN
ncbi:helix-hairpin-helix domain-containing protein [Mammaliicoccus sp. Dog046]|uniref:helix-hairpin-helix domain-containing protein n=1 Tax=Mammaliicoccus sp. Dog046 TaxID=3034233 RepID=UPI002B262935|nr:helix-hairpin-helix domain-containing protein [Mammaliicoccus sp. Dog046]WQK86559.1 helix-hairpin-helix domain-containing protein [Mammaliicoccus sp. Dog046]